VTPEKPLVAAAARPAGSAKAAERVAEQANAPSTVALAGGLPRSDAASADADGSGQNSAVGTARASEIAKASAPAAKPETVAESAGSTDGMADAQHPEAMAMSKNGQNNPDFSRQNMPSGGKSNSAEKDSGEILPIRSTRAARADSVSVGPRDASTAAQFSSANQVAAPAEVAGTTAREGATTGAKLAEQVWSTVESFRATSAHDWVVKLRPDDGTTIDLRLKLQDNQLQVQARLEKGNWETVGAGWGDLQSRLADRGVTLKSLENGTGSQWGADSFNQSNPGNPQQRQTGEELAMRQEFRQNFGAAGAVSAPPAPAAPTVTATPATGDKRLETWA